MEEILLYFPNELRNILKQHDLQEIEEIRLRNNCPVFLRNGYKEIRINFKVNTDILLEILQKICDNSIYTYQNQICNGYITVKGGHRVGITGNAIIKDGQVINISHIYSLNFRIAKQVFECSNQILKYVLDLKNNNIFNTIIVSPPGRGKTTILRDLVRKLSNGIEECKFEGINIGVVDERGEIAAMYKGSPQNDIGVRTDVLDNVPKDVGMKMLIRSMNPKVIVADEIGTLDDVKAIQYAIRSGVKCLCTAHGSSIEDVIHNPMLGQLYEINAFERILFIKEGRQIISEHEKLRCLGSVKA